MTGKIDDSKHFQVCKHFDKGNPGYGGCANLMSAEMTCPHWGVIDSLEFGFFRDDKRAFDLGLSNFGYRVTPKGPVLQLEIHDPTGVVADHTYDIIVQVNLL